jgi:hypothetical protein
MEPFIEHEELGTVGTVRELIDLLSPWTNDGLGTIHLSPALKIGLLQLGGRCAITINPDMSSEQAERILAGEEDS